MTTLEKMARAILAKVPMGYGMTEKESIEYARAVVKVLQERLGETVCGPALDAILNEKPDA